MERLTVDALIARLASLLGTAAIAERGAALAFDGDGTLWQGDVGDDFFHATVALGRYLPPAIEAMRAVGRAAGLDGMDGGEMDPDAGVAIARRLFEAYEEHRLPEEAMFEVIAWVCAGWREAEVNRLARDVVVWTDLGSRRHAELEAVLAWARGVGVESFLVSASPRPIVEAAGQPIGFDRSHILAATATFTAEGVMLPEVVRPIPYGPGKAALLEERLAGKVLLAAFGDNVFDVPMLQAARTPVLVEPKPRLLAHLGAMAATGAGLPEGFAAQPVALVMAGGG